MTRVSTTAGKRAGGRNGPWPRGRRPDGAPSRHDRRDDDPGPDQDRPQPADMAPPRGRLRLVAGHAPARAGDGRDGRRHAVGPGPSPARHPRPRRVRLLGVLDDPRRRGRGDQADRGRPVHRVHGVPQPGVAREDGGHARRGERRPPPARARERRPGPRRVVGRVRLRRDAARRQVRRGRGDRQPARPGRDAHLRGRALPHERGPDHPSRPTTRRHPRHGRRAGREDGAGRRPPRGPHQRQQGDRGRGGRSGRDRHRAGRVRSRRPRPEDPRGDRLGPPRDRCRRRRDREAGLPLRRAGRGRGPGPGDPRRGDLRTSRCTRAAPTTRARSPR